MRLEYLSAEWFDAVSQAARILPRQPGLDLVIATQLMDRGESHEQQYRDGLLLSWERVDSREASIYAVRPFDCDKLLSVAPHSGDSVAAGTVYEVKGNRVVSPPLLGPRASRLPTIAGADCSVVFHCSDSPYGYVTVSLVFKDGRLAIEEFGRLSEATIEIGTSFRQVARLLSASIALGEVVYDGDLRRGGMEDFAVLQGILGSEELRLTGEQRSVEKYFLRMAQLMDTDGFREWRRELTHITRP